MEGNKPAGPKPLVGRRKRKLYSRIKTQMEFYFSDSNLAKSNFLTNLMQQNDEGYVDLEVFKSFNKIKDMTTDIDIIVDALSRSSMLKVSEDKTKVKRITPLGGPKDFDSCTIYVEKLPPYADQKWIKDVFEHFGVVDFIRLPCHKISQKIKGFAFVEFNSPESVTKACEYYQNSDGKAVAESESENNESKPDHVRKTEDDGERKAKKRKYSEGSANAEKAEIVLDSVAKDGGSECHSDQEVTNRKRKMKSHQEETPSKKIRVVDSSSDQEFDKSNLDELEKHSLKDCSADGEVNSEDEIPGKNKRKRKHKKKHHSQSERPHLRVMTKQEWKVYRNKYLDLQRSTMSYLKKEILLETQEWKEKEGVAKTESPKKVQFQQGVIIKIKLKDPIENGTVIKDKVKANAVVAYIDAPVGHTEMYVRCHTPEEALSTIKEEKLQNLGDVELLNGSEEEAYWKKIENDKLVRYNMPSQKKRGRDKLIAKAAKLLEQKNKHIYFDE